MSKGMEKTHKMKMTGKTDKDFAMMMIQHHERADRYVANRPRAWR